jgi:hypothetical protein
VVGRAAGQVEEQLLESGALRRPEPRERHAAGERGAADGFGVRVDDEGAVGGRARLQGGVSQRGRQRRRVGRRHERAGVGQQLITAALGDDAPRADDHDPVGDGLDLPEQVRGEQHRAAAVGELAQQPAHPAHPLGVQAVGRLVEDQDLGIAEQRVRQPEALAHAQRVLAHALARRRAIESDAPEQVLDAPRVHADGLRGHGQRLAPAAAGVLRRGVEQDAHAPARVG